MNQIFYHFTAKRFLESIITEGITKGLMVISMSPPRFLQNKQWITVNPDFDQSWAVGTGFLPYKRNEVRITIKIPLEKMENCKPWSQMKFLTPLVANDLSCMGDPENWWIYQGEIKPKWITEVVYNDRQREETHADHANLL